MEFNNLASLNVKKENEFQSASVSDISDCKVIIMSLLATISNFFTLMNPYHALKSDECTGLPMTGVE